MNKYPSISQAFKILGFIIVLTVLIGIPLELLNEHILKLSDSLVNLIMYSIPILLSLIAFLLLIIIFTGPIDYLLPVPDWFNEIMSKFVSEDIFSFITVVIMAPILEELILRGVILDGFLKFYNPRKAILLSAFLFGLFHLNPWQFVPAFIGGLYLGWIYCRTKSIIPCIVIHSINNLTAFLIIVYDPNDKLSNYFDENKVIYIFIILISITIFTLGIRVLNEKLKSTHNGKIQGKPGFIASLTGNE